MPETSERLLSYLDLRERGIFLSKTSLWRLGREGKFPRPVKIGGGFRNFWIEREINEFLLAAIAKRDGSDPKAPNNHPLSVWYAAGGKKASRQGAETAAAATGAKVPAKAKKPAGKARKGRAKEAA